MKINTLCGLEGWWAHRMVLGLLFLLVLGGEGWGSPRVMAAAITWELTHSPPSGEFRAKFLTEGSPDDFLGTGTVNFRLGPLLEMSWEGEPIELSPSIFGESADVRIVGAILYDLNQGAVSVHTGLSWSQYHPVDGLSLLSVNVRPNLTVTVELFSDTYIKPGEVLSSNWVIQPVIIPEPRAIGVMVGLGALLFGLLRRFWRV